MTSLLDPSLPSSALLASYPSLRITSSSSIQGVVRSTLLHLSNPLSAPLLLHTLPSASSSASTSTAIVPKNSHAGLHKLISIVEIVKRELEQHQKEQWKEEDEREAKRFKKEKRAIEKGKGKKRARKEDIEGINDDNVATTSTLLADANGDPADGIAAPTAIDDNDQTKKASKTSSKKGKERPLLRAYQYNILDCYERLPGASHGVDQGDDDDDDTESSSEEDEDDAHKERAYDAGQINDENQAEADGGDGDRDADEASQVERELLANANATTAPVRAGPPRKRTFEEMQLDAAISNRVKHGRKRPRKKHTPYTMIILSTTRLPALEIACKKENKSLSIQLPAKRARARSRGAQARKGHKKRAEAAEQATAAAAAVAAADAPRSGTEEKAAIEKRKEVGQVEREVGPGKVVQESGQGESEAAAVLGSSVMQAEGGQALS